jgi:glycine/D-amino acid oxidase-like deaminating enzyme
VGPGRGIGIGAPVDEIFKPMKRTFSFWEREEWLKKPDLLIAGAGIVGASAALFYKEKYPDHDVMIVDKGIAPEGASTRNAGFTCIGSMSEHLADMKIAGRETVLKRIERRWNGLHLLRKTMGEEMIDYRHTGGYEIFTDETMFTSCQANIDEMNKELKGRLGINDVYSATEYEGFPAIFNHVEGAINSGKLMRELHRRLAAVPGGRSLGGPLRHPRGDSPLRHHRRGLRRPRGRHHRRHDPLHAGDRDLRALGQAAPDPGRRSAGETARHRTDRAPSGEGRPQRPPWF